MNDGEITRTDCPLHNALTYRRGVLRRGEARLLSGYVDAHDGEAVLVPRGDSGVHQRDARQLVVPCRGFVLVDGGELLLLLMVLVSWFGPIPGSIEIQFSVVTSHFWLKYLVVGGELSQKHAHRADDDPKYKGGPVPACYSGRAVIFVLVLCHRVCCGYNSISNERADKNPYA